MVSLLGDFLRSQGFRVQAFTSGAAALAALSQSPTGFPGAVIAHLRMEPMDGLQLLSAIKRDYPQLPVVLFTGEGSHGDEAQAALRLGAAHCLTKPFSLAGLKDMLAELM